MPFMKNYTRIHIFKTGKRTSGNGVERAYSKDDLAQCAANYAAETFKAPLVLGHPQNGAPAYGWVENLEAEGENLYANVSTIDPLLKNAVAAGAYKNLSASFYLEDSPFNPKPGALYLRHVGILGAEPPAIKDLEPLVFNEEPTALDFVFFNEEPSMPEIEKNEALTVENHDSTPAPKTEPAPAVDFSEYTAQIDALKNQLQSVTAEKDAALQMVKDLQKAERKKGHADFTERLIKDGKLAPAQADVVVATLEALSETAVNFGEGEACKSLEECFKELLQNLTPAVPLVEAAAADFSEPQPVDLASLSGTEALKLYKEDKAAFLKAAGR